MALRPPLLLTATAAVLAMLASACGLLEKRAELRYRMTVTLERDGRRISAQGVQEIKAVAVRALTAEHLAGAARVNGEALFLDTASGPLFLSLRTRIGAPELHNAVLQALNGSVPSKASDYIAALRRLSRRDGKAVLAPEHWPLAIALPGPDDPTAARFMTASEAGITSVTVEVTDEPVSTPLKDRFPWLATFTVLPVPAPADGLIPTELDPRVGGRTAYLQRSDFIFNPTDPLEQRLWERQKAADDAAREAQLRQPRPAAN